VAGLVERWIGLLYFLGRRARVMIGQLRVSNPSAELSHKVLRSKLNGLSYFQPLSEESLALADRLLGDLARSSENLRALQRRIGDHERDIQEQSAELEALRREHPRLLKENTELHRRVLSDSQERERRSVGLAERLQAANGKLSHARLLHRQESLRAAALQQSSRLLHNHLRELERRGAGSGAAAAGVRPRLPSISLWGAPPQGSSADGCTHHVRCVAGPIDEDAPNLAVLAACAPELTEELATMRSHRALAASRFVASELEVNTERAEVGRLMAYADRDDSAVGSSTAIDDGSRSDAMSSATAIRTEESKLSSQVDFLKRTIGTMHGRRQALQDSFAEAKSKLSELRSNQRFLEQEITRAQNASKEHKRAAEEGAAQRHEAVASVALQQRGIANERLELDEQRGQLERELEEVRGCAKADADTRQQQLEGIRRKLVSEMQAGPLEEHRRLEVEMEAIAGRRVENQVRCADLSARLAAMRVHEGVHQRALIAVMEEVSASQRARDAGGREARSLDSQLRDVQASMLEVRGEVETLHACLEETTTKHRNTSLERATARREVAALMDEAEERRQAQDRLAAEAEHARADAEFVEERVVEARREGELLRMDEGRLRHDLTLSEERLGAVQARHRALSSGVDRIIPELLWHRAEQRSDILAGSELEVLIEDVGLEMRRATAECEDVEMGSLRERQRLGEAVQAARTATEEVARQEHGVHQALLSRLSCLEPDVYVIRQELMELAAEEPRMWEGLRARTATTPRGASQIWQEEILSEEAFDCLRAGAECHAADEQRLQWLIAERASHESLVECLTSRTENCLEILQKAELEEAAVGATATLEAQELANADAAVVVARRRLENLSGAGRSARDGLAELELQQGQLGALVHSLQSTREQLVGQLRDVGCALDDEPRLHEEALAGPSSTRARVEELAEEAGRLRRTLVSVDGDHAELISVATARLRRLGQLSEQMAQLRSARADMQWGLDRMRHTVDLQQGEIVDRVHEIEVYEQEAEVLGSEQLAARNEARERKRDASLAIEDLLHMTRENQLLHDQLLQIQQQHETLSLGAQEHKAMALPRAQYLQDMKMEREKVVRIYQQTVDECQRNEAAISEVALQGDHARADAKVMQRRVLGACELEHEERARSLQAHSELLALRTRIGGVTRALEAQGLAQEEAEAERTRVQHSMGLRQATISAAYLSDVAAGAELDSIRQAVVAQQEELQNMLVAAADTHRDLEEARRQQARLQEMLSHQRQVQQQAQLEHASLRRSLGDVPSGAAAGAPRARTQDVNAALYRTLVQQAELLAEMGGEARGLEAEVMEFREGLQAWDGMAEAGAPGR